MFLDEISDDLLICLYREGNQVAIDLLYDRYTTFLYGFIHKMLKKETGYFEYKDLFHEVFVIFISCINKYDEDNGCFYYFVKVCVERKLVDYFSRMARYSKVLSLDDGYYKQGNEACIDYVEEDNTVMYYETELYEALEERLDEFEMKIIDMKMEGYSYQEMSSLFGINKQAIYRKVVIIKNVIKDILEKID